MTWVLSAVCALLFGVCVCWWKDRRELVDANTTMMLAERYHQQQMQDIVTYYESRQAPAQSQVQRKVTTWLN